MTMSSFHTLISHPNIEECPICCWFLTSQSGDSVISLLARLKSVWEIYSLCVLVHNRELAISLCISGIFVALLKCNSVIIVSSMQNDFSVPTNSPVNMLCTHLLCTVLRAWGSYLKCFLKLLHSEVGVSCLRVWPTFADFCIQVIL